MDQTLTFLIALSALGFAFSGVVTPWISYPIGILLILLSPLIGKFFSDHSIPGAAQSKTRLNKRIEKQKKRRFIENNREKIGSQYFRTTFLLAGNIAAADGKVCKDELQKLNGRFIKLGLNDAQIQEATDFFHQGQAPDFNVGVELIAFMKVCGELSELCDSLLTTQFSFVDANGEVSMAEFKIINLIASRLQLNKKFNRLLEEFQLRAEVHAEKRAQEKMEERRRQRDKKRTEAEKERITKNNNVKNRKLLIALAVLGLKKNASITEIKKAYRTQIKRNHPDRLLANGYPEELLGEATMRSAEINRSYKILKEHYRFR